MIRLLDHGFVRLVSFTRPALDIQLENWTGDLEIIRNARVSHDADWRTDGTILHEPHCLSILPPMSNGETRECNCQPRTISDSRLMDYLYKNFHSTPFEAIEFTFEVQAPIFVFRQWHRHRTWTYNEVSARYTELPSVFYTPPPDKIGRQDVRNKQGRVIDPEAYDSYEEAVAAGLSPADLAKLAAEFDRRQRISQSYQIEGELAHRTYRDRLGEGVPREIARANLPLSTYSRMFGKVSLWNLFRFLDRRDHPHAQYEVRVYAQALKELVRPIVPEAMRAYDRFKSVVIDQNERDQIVQLPTGERVRVIFFERYSPQERAKITLVPSEDSK